MNIIKRLRHNQAAATAIEYGLIAALVSVAALAGFNALGGSVTDLLTGVREAATTSIDNSVNSDTTP